MSKTTVRQLQSGIVRGLEAGKDVSKLLKELSELRQEIAMEAEQLQLGKIVAARREARQRAAKAQEAALNQGKAIDMFLAKRDALLAILEPTIQPALELAALGKPAYAGGTSGVYSIPDGARLNALINQVPAELLPAGFSCPALVMSEPSLRSDSMAARACELIQQAIAILQAFEKGSISMPAKPAGEDLMLDPHRERCSACEHADAVSINQDLREGKSLREIEARFEVSRSTLSRHRSRCLNLGAVRFVPSPDTESSNKTYFGGE